MIMVTLSKQKNPFYKFLRSKVILQEEKIAAYNNMGATNSLLGKFHDALDYYNNAETLVRIITRHQLHLVIFILTKL